MIAIRNVSTRVRRKGSHTYEISVTQIDGAGKVTKRTICRFRHLREEGMAVCLEKAAAAVRKSKMDETHRLLMDFFGELQCTTRAKG